MVNSHATAERPVYRSARSAFNRPSPPEKTVRRPGWIRRAVQLVLAANMAFLIRLCRYGVRDSLARLRYTYNLVRPFEPKASRQEAAHPTIESQLAALQEVDLSDLIDSSPTVLLDASYRYEDRGLSVDQLLIVLALLRQRQPKTVLEIGTFCGTTTKAMAFNLPDSTIHTVDLPLDYDPRLDSESVIPKDDLHLVRTRRVGESYRIDPRCSHIIQHFTDTANWDFLPAQGATFVFIDGSHTYEYCKNDTNKALAICGPDAIFVWHDCDLFHPGVVTCLNELLAAGHKVVRVRGTTLGVLQTGGSV
jgi:hypothetical protein